LSALLGGEPGIAVPGGRGRTVWEAMAPDWLAEGWLKLLVADTRGLRRGREVAVGTGWLAEKPREPLI